MAKLTYLRPLDQLSGSLGSEEGCGWSRISPSPRAESIIHQRTSSESFA